MRVLITGGTGFIGSRLAMRCLDLEYETRLLGQDRNPVEAANAELLRSRGADLRIGSVADLIFLSESTAGIDVVFHLAAAQHEANVPDQHFWDVNVHGTENLIKASLESGVGTFVHGSSIGVYGGKPGLTITDDSPLEPDNIYGVTKLAGERAVEATADRLKSVILRISEVYGPGDRRLLKLFKGVKNRSFPLIGKGENLHHLIYIEDLIDCLLLASNSTEAVGRSYVVAGNRAVTTREMIESAAKLYGVAPPRYQLPFAPLMWGARALESTLRPLGIQPPLHPRRMNFFWKSFDFSLEDFRRVPGFRPQVDLDEGFRLTADWYQDQGLVS